MRTTTAVGLKEVAAPRRLASRASYIGGRLPKGYGDMASVRGSFIRLVVGLVAVVATASGPALAQSSVDGLHSGIETLDRAVDSLLHSGNLPYSAALGTVQEYALQGNIVAMRAAAAIWLYQVADTEHRISYTNAYFGTRALVRVSPTDEVPLPDPNDFASDTEGLWFSFNEQSDLFTDQVTCELVSDPVGDIALGFDNKGAFIESARPIQDESFARFAIRVDGSTAFVGEEPAEATQRRTKKEAISRLFARKLISFEESQELLQALENDSSLRAKRVYVATAGTTQLERLLRELSLGNRALARAMLLDGSESIAEFDLAVDASSISSGQMINIFDFFGYRYASCVYGRLH